MSKLNYGKDLKDWRAAFAVKDAGNSWNLSQSSDEGGDIYAPGSMPVDWNRRKVPALLEWRNPWYSHEPRTSERILPEMSSWKLAPRTSAARPRASGNYHHLELSCDGTRSSQAWTVALCALLGCRDPHELRVSLDLVNKAAFALMPPELGLAYADFEAVIQQKRETSAHIFTSAGDRTKVSVIVTRLSPFLRLVRPLPKTIVHVLSPTRENLRRHKPIRKHPFRWQPSLLLHNTLGSNGNFEFSMFRMHRQAGSKNPPAVKRSTRCFCCSGRRIVSPARF